jgi:hypothetical protein
MAARTLLLKLQARGLIDLPAPRNGNGNRQRRAQAHRPMPGELLPRHPELITGALSVLQPLTLGLVAGLAERDRFIGWSAAQRRQGLPRITNQQRFLILPWVRVLPLASHVLALALRQLSADRPPMWRWRCGVCGWRGRWRVGLPRRVGRRGWRPGRFGGGTSDGGRWIAWWEVVVGRGEKASVLRG